MRIFRFLEKALQKSSVRGCDSDTRIDSCLSFFWGYYSTVLNRETCFSTPDLMLSTKATGNPSGSSS